MRLAAVACPANTNGASVVAGCTADAGYHGTVTPTTTSPYYAVGGVNGASVQLCTSQTGCGFASGLMRGR